MRILQFSAENFKRIRIVEITPKKRITQLTGRNGQGKTSVLDAMWALLKGKRAIPDKPVRKGADRSRLKAIIGDENGKPLLIASRTIHADRTTEVKIEAAPGAERPAGTPQAVLDALVGEMSFDPIAFIHMEPAAQVETLRKIVPLSVDLEQLNAANDADYERRTKVKKEADRLEIEAMQIIVQELLPAAKVDDSAIMDKIRSVDGLNQQARMKDQAKRDSENIAKEFEERWKQRKQSADEALRRISQIETELKHAKENRSIALRAEEQAGSEAQKAKASAEAMPAGEYADVTALTQQLQDAQTINREIDKRTKRDAIQKQIDERKREANELTRAMQARIEQKNNAIAEAKIPVDGLTFNEEGVLFKGIPLEQLGEAEQIRVSAALAMAANPKLRAIPIHHGESLDDNSLALLEELAEKEDFQIFMARVDTSGKIGIVLSDGMVETENA